MGSKTSLFICLFKSIIFCIRPIIWLFNIKALIDDFTRSLFINLEKLSHYYFLDVRDAWIKNNKKYFIEDSGWKPNDLGMMYPYTNYYFSKENIAKVDKEIEEYKKTDEYKEKLRKKQESEERYSKLYELALELNDEDFEDITGLPREHFLD